METESPSAPDVPETNTSHQRTPLVSHGQSWPPGREHRLVNVTNETTHVLCLQLEVTHSSEAVGVGSEFLLLKTDPPVA